MFYFLFRIFCKKTKSVLIPSITILLMVQKVMERVWWVERYWSNYYGVSINKYGVKCGISLWFWENNGWISKIDPYGWFQWYFRYWLGRRSLDNERQINRWKKLLVDLKVN